MTHPRKKQPHIRKSLREAVLRRDGHQCQYPQASGICGATELLCVHDTTHTGQHAQVSDCTTFCQTHHNRATQANRSAQVKLRRINANINAYRQKQLTLLQAD